MTGFIHLWERIFNVWPIRSNLPPTGANTQSAWTPVALGMDD